MKERNYARFGWLALLVAGAIFPLLTSNDYFLSLMTTAFIFAIATLGLNLLVGYTGQFNLAHAGFMAIGAYSLGVLTVTYELNFWLAFVAAGFITLIVGFPLGWLSLRLRGHYFSIFTLCVGYILFLIIDKWDAVTQGSSGLIGIPEPAPLFGIEFDSVLSLYYLILFFLVIAVIAMLRIVHSLPGRTFMAIRNGDELAQALGINLMRNKLVAFLISVLYAGLAGALYAGVVRFLGPELAEVHHTFDMTMYMLVGGMGTVFGPLLGSLTMPWLTQSLQFLEDFRFIVFGPLLIILIIYLPEGIVGRWLEIRQRKKAAAHHAQLTAQKKEASYVEN